MYKFKKKFWKPNKKITANEKNSMCSKRRSSRPCPVPSKTCNTSEKVGQFSKIYRGTQANSGDYKKQNNLCEEENNSSQPAYPASLMGWLFTKKQDLSMSATWLYILINKCNLKMLIESASDMTAISSKMKTELDKPQLDGKFSNFWWSSINASGITYLWRWVKRKQGTTKQPAVVHSNKEFWQLSADLLPKQRVKNITTEQLLAVEGYRAHVKLTLRSQPMFRTSRKLPLPLHDKVTEEPVHMVRHGNFEPVQPGGMENGDFV